MKIRASLAVLAALLAAATAHAQTRPAARPASAPQPAAAAPAAAPANGVASDPEKENAGKAAATGWLTLLDRRDWGGAWERSSGLFRQNVPLGKWMDAIPKEREPFGALVEREAVGVIYKTTLPGHPSGDYVSVMFASKFEKKPDVREVVTTVREADGRWRVTGYQAQ